MFRRVLVIIVAAAAGVVGLFGVLPAAAQQGDGNATRSFDQDTVAAGGQVVVTIEATGYGSLGAVTETLPAGFSYVSSSLTDEGEVTEIDARNVRFTLQGADKTFMYTVTASSTADDYDFSGTLRDSDKVDSVVGGDSSVTVEAAAQSGGGTATRSFDQDTVAAGGEVMVTIAATGYGSLGAVTEMLPAGFSYVSSSLTDEGEVTEVDDVTVRFTLQGADKTFMYTVTASSTADDYDFSGTLRDSDKVDSVVGGDSSVTVEAAAVEPSSAVATRSFDPTSVAPEGQVVVTIEATGYGSLGAVTETLPAGFSYVSSNLTDEGEVTEVDARNVRFTLQGADKTFMYTVTASSTADDYDFSGTLRDSDKVDSVVGGDTRVTVEAVAVEPSSAVATRSFDPTSVAPEGQVVVTIEATGYGSLGAVTETLPDGFSYVSSNLTDEGEVTEVDARNVRFTLQGADKTFTYTVTASSMGGTHDFSGMLRDADKVDSVVGGASSVAVLGPRATRTFSSRSVRPSGRVTVTITAADYGSLGAVTETLPAGFSYESSSLVDEGEVTEVDDRTVRFTLQGAGKTFTYTVAASSTTGTYDFSGELRDSDKNDHDVGGADRVTVARPATVTPPQPTATATPPPSTGGGGGSTRRDPTSTPTPRPATATPTPTPTPETGTATPTPMPTPTATPTPTPTPTAVPAPVATPTPTPRLPSTGGTLPLWLVPLAILGLLLAIGGALLFANQLLRPKDPHPGHRKGFRG